MGPSGLTLRQAHKVAEGLGLAWLRSLPGQGLSGAFPWGELPLVRPPELKPEESQGLKEVPPSLSLPSGLLISRSRM